MALAYRVGVGIGSFPFSSASAFFRWVDLCEAGGVDSLWQSDRLVSADAQLESLATMAALAGATRRIKFGMNAVVASLRDPLLLAKQCATIDYLSDGRLLPVFGVGAGFAPEWKATGRDPAGRGERANEALEIIARLWSEESVSFQGKYYRYENARIAPRPVQQPLPLWIGGNSRAAIRRTARLGTGWLGGIASPRQVEEVVTAIRSEGVECGRALPEDHFGATIPFRFGSWDHPLVEGLSRARLLRVDGAPDPKGLLAVGRTEEVLGRIGEYAAAGASKFVLIPIARGDDDVLDQTRRLVEEVIPVVEQSGSFGPG